MLFNLDIDECLDGTAECDEHAICKNTMGSYECDCKEGFFGDGALCMGITYFYTALLFQGFY